MSGSETLLMLTGGGILLGLAGYFARKAADHWGATSIPGDRRDGTACIMFSILASACGLSGV